MIAAHLGLFIVLAHLVGDYIIQTDWMAQQKTTRWWPAIVHAVTYTVPYAFITHDWRALLIIGGTHAIIDRYRLAKHLIWVKNQAGPKSARYPWSDARDNAGFAAGTPPFMSTWLMIITDNTVHLLINTAAILLVI